MTDTPLFQGLEGCTSKLYLFKNSELGKIHAAIPWDELAKCLPEQKQNTCGRESWFSHAGMFGVMFLKHYTNLSDEKLIERINTDWAMQLFCGILIQDHVQIKDKAIVSRIRKWLADNVESLNDAQSALITHWKLYMEQTDELQMDASCYESYIRYPTDVKLLWECCSWVFEKALFPICKELNLTQLANIDGDILDNQFITKLMVHYIFFLCRDH